MSDLVGRPLRVHPAMLDDAVAGDMDLRRGVTRSSPERLSTKRPLAAKNDRESRAIAPLRCIAVVATCVPRQCGIATFAEDLRLAMTAGGPGLSAMTVAVTDNGNRYDYPAHVPLEIVQEDRRSYAVAADFLNVADVEVISIQHEFGIFGGAAGEYVLELMRRVHAPIVTTLHTVLAGPDSDQRRVMDEIIARSAHLIVMAEKGRWILETVYAVDAEKISVVPHGVPDRPFIDPAMAKRDLALADRTLLMTFGLLGPGKGIETAIRAMPQLVRLHPKILYMIVGATHPVLRQREGEAYRQQLTTLTEKLNLADNVCFVDRYLSLDELLQYLSSCDIYLSPYPNEAQIVSGTLAYAVALGKAVVSTPFWHARELLADQCGLLVPFDAPDGLAQAVHSLISDDGLRSEVRTRAYARGRTMTWPHVAEQYLRIFSDVRMKGPSGQAEIIPLLLGAVRKRELPPVVTARLGAMTDNVGIIQHAHHSVPDRKHGYCLDDNARALQLMAEIGQLRPLSSDEQRMMLVFSAFVEHAWRPAEGQFHNFMGFNREWIGRAGADDAHGRAVWALGTVVRHGNRGTLDDWAAARLLEFAPPLVRLSSPRVWAYGLLGIEGFLARFPGHLGFERLRSELSSRLFQRWHDAATPDWLWFEDRLGYDNARLCEALLIAGHAQSNASQLEAALESLGWLMAVQTTETGLFRPVGTESFGFDRKHPAPFDQQPIEVWSAVSACLAAAKITGDQRWSVQAWRAFNWFLGANDLGVPVADSVSGACFDGLHPDRRNANQGAESTLAYLAALTAIALAEEHTSHLAARHDASGAMVAEPTTTPIDEPVASQCCCGNTPASRLSGGSSRLASDLGQ